MLAEIGIVFQALALAASIYASIAAFLSARRRSERLLVSARSAALLTFPLLLGAAAMLLMALINQQYQISYVWQVTDPSTPLFYRITALWGSQQGSLLFWTVLMSAFAFASLLLNWRENHRLMPYVIVFQMAALAFFAGISLLIESPFARYWVTQPAPSLPPVVEAHLFIPTGAEAPPMVVQPSGDGFFTQGLAQTANGLNPLLRHFGMIIHPPMLYLGFVGFLVPFAYAMAALASGDLTTNWIKATRRWTLIAWLFLSLGLILGGRWAYDVLGWGGYWGWDPVENAAFIPWLVGTAFLHSVLIQEKRGMLKTWNMFLVIFTFSAVLFGTFATRSGLIESVHSFAQSAIGLPMFLFWLIMTVIGVWLIMWRRGRGELRDEHGFAGWLSRETLFVLNNVVFVALALAIFWGSFGAPIVSETFMDTEITLGAAYYSQVTVPLFAAMYILMGVAPLAAWGAMTMRRMGRALVVPLALTAVGVVVAALLGARSAGTLFAYGIVLLAGIVALYEIYRGARARMLTSRESLPVALLTIFGRNRRRYGGFIVHLGIVIIGIGVIGSTAYQLETIRQLGRSAEAQIGAYSVRYDSLELGQIAEDGRLMDIANVTVLRAGQPVAQIRPRVDHYPGMSVTIPGAHSTIEGDVYVLLSGYNEADGSTATLHIYVNPLINFVWWGGLILIVGTLISAWKDERAPERVRSAATNGRVGAAA
jgi:cytochrome c-type biogenesis protein CcmF